MRLLLALSTALLSACGGPEHAIGLRQPIHHDDFDYSVERVDTLARIGSLTPSGIFYVVTFQVDNRAQVVDHQWGNDIAYIVDDEGGVYENDAGAQAELGNIQPFDRQVWHVTRAGDRETTRLVFDLPAQVKAPYLKVRGWPLMGDLFDGIQFRRVKVRLF